MSPVLIYFALAALLVFGSRNSWRVVRTAVTVVHEFGHAFVVMILGGEIRRFTVRLDTSGEVVHALPKGRIRTILVSSAGYPAPSIVAAFLTYGVFLGWQKWVLYGMAIIATITMLLWVRNLWAFIILVGFSLLFFALAQWFTPLVQTAVLWLLIGILGFGGLKAAFEQFYRECDSDPSEQASDARTVARLIFLPRTFVSFLFLLVCVVATCSTGWIIFKTQNWVLPFLS